jgi:hypothetical protein
MAAPVHPAMRLFLAIVLVAATWSAVTYVRGVFQRDPHGAERGIPGTAWNVVPLLSVGVLALLLVFRLKSRRACVAFCTLAVTAAGVVAGTHWFWQSRWPLTLLDSSRAESLLVFVPLYAIILGAAAARLAFYLADPP